MMPLSPVVCYIAVPLDECVILVLLCLTLIDETLPRLEGL